MRYSTNHLTRVKNNLNAIFLIQITCICCLLYNDHYSHLVSVCHFNVDIMCKNTFWFASQTRLTWENSLASTSRCFNCMLQHKANFHHFQQKATSFVSTFLSLLLKNDDTNRNCVQFLSTVFRILPLNFFEMILIDMFLIDMFFYC